MIMDLAAPQATQMPSTASENFVCVHNVYMIRKCPDPLLPSWDLQSQPGKLSVDYAGPPLCSGIDRLLQD